MNTTVLNLTLASNISAPSETSDSQFNSDNTQFSDELQRAKSQTNNQTADTSPDNTTDSNTQTHKKHKSAKVNEKTKPVTQAGTKPAKDANAAKDSQSSAPTQNPAAGSDSATTQLAQAAQAANANLNQTADNSQPADANPKSDDPVNPADSPLPQKLASNLSAGAKSLKSANAPSQDDPTQQTVDVSQARDGSQGGLSEKKPNVSPFKSAGSSTAPAASNNSDAAAVQSAAHADAKNIPAVSTLDAQFPAIFAALAPQTPNANHASPAVGIAPGTFNTDPTFSAANHANIVTTVRTQLLPDGGTMQIRLDPPDLGTMRISVTVESGVVSASFQTSNDQATQLVTHSLSQLKAALETQGVTVDKLHVQQTSRSENSSNDSSSGDRNSSRQQGSLSDSTNQQEQQRRELLRKMWQRVAGNKDELDMVA